MKILIVRLGALGDIIHTIPAQLQIAKHLPESEIHWLAEPRYEEFLCQIQGVSRVWTADTKRWRRSLSSLREVKALTADLRQERFDVAFDFQGLVKSALLARLSGARGVIGFESTGLRERPAAWFYDSPRRGRKISRLLSPLRSHVIEMNLELLRSFGLPISEVNARIPLAIPTGATRYVDENLQALKIEHPLLIAPGAGWETKIWPAANYAQLVLKVRRELRLPAILTYGPGEEELITQIQRALAPEGLPAFPTTLLQLAALCRKSRLLVGSDTGPLHLAVALGTPTVALMGPTYPWRNGPFNPVDEVVSCAIPAHLAYKRKGDPAALMNIAVEEVFQAVARRLQKL